jgi:hypothetical protein
MYRSGAMIQRVKTTPLSAGEAFVQAVKEAGCKLGIDGCGAWRDKVFVERLAKSVRHERVYLYAYDSVAEARASITRYNESPPYQPLTSNSGCTSLSTIAQSIIPFLKW